MAFASVVDATEEERFLRLHELVNVGLNGVGGNARLLRCYARFQRAECAVRQIHVCLVRPNDELRVDNRELLLALGDFVDVLALVFQELVAVVDVLALHRDELFPRGHSRYAAVVLLPSPPARCKVGKASCAQVKALAQLAVLKHIRVVDAPERYDLLARLVPCTVEVR